MIGQPAHVLWLTKGLGLGGAERLLVGGARHTSREHYAVEVAYVLPWKDALVPELLALDVPVHCLNGRATADLSWLLRLSRLLRERDYDLIHTHLPVPAVAARLLARSGVPLVHTEHNMWGRQRRLTRTANAITYHRNAAVIAVCQAVADSLPARLLRPGPRRHGRPIVETVYHGIDRTRLPASTPGQSRTVLGLPAGAFAIGSVGNFTAKKDHRTLLSAFAELRSSHPEARLVLVGSGPLEPELRRQAAQLGVAADVTFTGSRSDVPLLLPGFDVFAASSRQEGLPIAVVEAMACGVPIVATRVGGLPELVPDGAAGLLVPPGDPAALAKALRQVAEDEVRRAEMGGQARRHAAAFDVAVAQRRVEQIYDAVLDRR